jgi:predicted transcriptional regulator of viral defense system
VDDLIFGQHRRDIPGSLREAVREQAGVVSRKQALDSGLSSAQIKHRITSERWTQLYAGVYSVFTGPQVPDAIRWSAVLWGGTGAVISFESAAGVHGLLDGPPPEASHISVPLNRRVRPAPGITIHLSKHVTGLRFGRGELPVTSPADTVLDLAAAADTFAAAEPWVVRALRRGVATGGGLKEAMDARKKLRWRTEIEGLIGTLPGE